MASLKYVVVFSLIMMMLVQGYAQKAGDLLGPGFLGLRAYRPGMGGGVSGGMGGGMGAGAGRKRSISAQNDMKAGG